MPAFITSTQLIPLSVERKTLFRFADPDADAKILVPLTPRALTLVNIKPELTAFQFAPPVVERNTPPPLVPAKRLVPIQVRARIEVLDKPIDFQFTPLSIEENIPQPFVPANIFVPIVAIVET